MSLLIAMPGPQLPELEADVPIGRDGLPALPALSALLRRARRLAAATDWRTGVQIALLGSVGGEIPPVAVAAQAGPALPVGTALCFAAPLHVVAGMSRVHLPPGGWLQLHDVEAARWLEAFNREFGGADLQLHAVSGGWLLVAPCALGAHDPAPETLIGEPLSRVSASDASERSLRRLGAEVEIWLMGHALNRERESQQLPPINNLWFWGGARTVQLPPCAYSLRAIYVAGAPDAWLAGLAAHCAVPLSRVNDWSSLSSADDALLVLASPPQGAAAGYWQQLEASWFEPAARALRTGAIHTLRLQIGGNAWQLPDPSLLRWLRRSRPWHEQVRP